MLTAQEISLVSHNVKSVSSGFTLIELMIIIAILGVLFAVAQPSMKTMLVNHQADSLVSELELDVQFARNMAINRTSIISIRPLGGSWGNGWRIRDDGVNETLRERGSASLPKAEQGGITSSFTTGAPLSFDAQGKVIRTGNFNVNVPGCSGKRNTTLHIQFLGQIVIKRVAC